MTPDTHQSAIIARLRPTRRVERCGCVYYGNWLSSPCERHEEPETEEDRLRYCQPQTAGRSL